MTSRSLVLVGVVALAAAALLVVAWRDGGTAAQRVLVDERRGVLHGVRFGDSEQAVRRRLGEPDDDHEGFFPEGAEYTGPPAIPSPAGSERPTPLHYGKTAYLVSATAGVFSMATLEAGARTRAGVAVGDQLARVRDRYDRVRCGEAVAGEALFGGETPKYAWCRALVGKTRVFFGADPVESITLTRYR